MSSFEEIAHDSGVRQYVSRPRVVSLDHEESDEVATMEDQICWQMDYEQIDPALACDYKDFVNRAWREKGFPQKQIDKLRRTTLKDMGLTEER